MLTISEVIIIYHVRTPTGRSVSSIISLNECQVHLCITKKTRNFCSEVISNTCQCKSTFFGVWENIFTLKVKYRVVLIHTRKAYRGVKVQHHLFLTLALYGGEQSSSCLDWFTLAKGALATHWTEGWVGPTASLDVLEKSLTSCTCWQHIKCAHRSAV